MPVLRCPPDTLQSISALLGRDLGCNTCKRPFDAQRPLGSWHVSQAGGVTLATSYCGPCSLGQYDEVALRQRRAARRMGRLEAIATPVVEAVTGLAQRWVHGDWRSRPALAALAALAAPIDRALARGLERTAAGDPSSPS